MERLSGQLLFPRHIRFGTGVVSFLGDEVRALGYRRALLLVDPGVADTPFMGRVRESLTKASVTWTVYSDIESNPTFRTVEKCNQFAQTCDFDIVVGVGGGSALDVAKCIAVTAGHRGSVRQTLAGHAVPPRAVGLALVPTTAGSGSEVSQAVVLVDEITGRKMGIHHRSMLADLAMVDAEALLTLPLHVLVDTACDALSHAVEAYLSPASNCVSDLFAARAISLVVEALPVALAESPGSIAAITREKLCIGSMLAGMAFTGASLGAVHALSYPLTTMGGLSHGRANAVMLPWVLEFYATRDLPRLKQLAGTWGAGGGSVKGLVKAFVEFIARVGIACRLSNYFPSRTVLPTLVEEALAQGQKLLSLAPCTITAQDVASIYTSAW